VAGIDALLFLVVIPTVGAATAGIVLWRSADATRREFPTDEFSSSTRPVAAAGALAITPAVLGIALWWIIAPIADTFSGPARYSPSEAVLLYAAMVAYGTAAITSTLSTVLVYHARMRSVLGTDFGRVLPIAVIPLTGVVFALVLNFLLVGILSAELHGSAFVDITSIPSATAAFQAFALAVVAFPVAAWVSNHVKNLSGRGFARALIVMEAGELPVLLGLVLGFLAIEALPMP
jgi:hypothetical protein